MRNSKSRNRSNKNRNNNRSMGNIMNRVFDSSGPEGKVRGTPQQIIDKYTQLARDAQLSGDRVAFENFQQHSEHYSRMLADAQRDQDARREQQEKENRERQAQRDQERADRQDAKAANDAPGGSDLADAPQPDAMAVADTDNGMAVVDAPDQSGEDAAKPKPRRRRAPKKDAGPDDANVASEPVAGAAE
ncbi:MAG: DUF4167 domain-containing protein [Pseudomonadota bacterium]